MPLPSGLRLGSYEVQRPIGAGGMGEVYLARDTRLNRDVALKVLPHEFTQDADRLARFMREAQLLASLNHPNIAAIYGLEESQAAGGPAPAQALVLELVEGPTLADVIAQPGPNRPGLSIDAALQIARQIAEALEAAHEQGIVHRDLKPANIKVRPDGRVKVLDFGLAKLTGAPEKSSASGPMGDPARSPTYLPTMSPAVTAIGAVLGTAAYMSPEQAKGRPADRRSDVWAFGCVLFEMLAGSRPFNADDVSGTVAAILERQPPWDRLPDATPPIVRRLLRRCLEKDPKRRLHDIADARLEIDDAIASPVDGDATIAARPTPAWIAAVVVVTALAAGAIVWVLKPSHAALPDARLARFLIAPAEPMPQNDGVLVISRDGRRVVYAAGPAGRQRLFVREIDQYASKAIPETDGVVSATFSPDGQSMAFIADRKLRTVALAGGMPLTLRDRVDGVGLAWTGDRTILYNAGTATGIWRIPVTGGEPDEIAKTGPKDNWLRYPEMLPNGKALLFTAQGGVNDDAVYVESLPGRERRFVVKGSAPHFLPTGHLAFVQGGTLLAVRFDPERLEASGPPVTLLEGVRQTALGAPLVSYSDTGSIVYVPTSPGSGSNRLVWVDRSGGEQPPSVASGQPYAQPRLSPDGRRLVTAMSGNNEDLWLIDLTRGTSSRLTTNSNTSFPVWTPDGRRLTLASAREGSYSIYWRPVDGSAPDEPLMTGKWPYYPFSWAPDGKRLAVVSVNPSTLQDIGVLDADRKGTLQPFLETPFREGGPAFSPDGKWIAYVSDESGRFEIYARPFPGPGEKWLISTDGGNEPVWPRNGKQLFYRAGDSVMAVDIELTPVFSAGRPRKLFDGPYERSAALWANYDASPDAQRLLMVRRENPAPPATHINVVLNWLEELKQKLPVQ